MSATRRELLQSIGAAATLAATSSLVAQGTGAQSNPAARVPWYRRARRWGQTNITEADMQTFDLPWWREYWKRTSIQGVIVNAGGIVAYYPSKFELQYRPPALNGRDLFGEIAKAAHDDGIAVLARMDSSKAREPLYRAHPDWFAVDANGRPYRSEEFYVSCVNSPYYEEWIAGILREIIERSHPEGFTDNSWAGTDRNQICYCANCKQRFGQFGGGGEGMALPQRRDWTDPAFRKWIEFSYARRIELWEFNNKVTREAGGADCVWSGMVGGSVSSQASSFRDLKEITARAEIVMLDYQTRESGGLQENAIGGKLVRSVLGWDKLLPESMAMYQSGRPTYRLTAKSPPEARIWMLSGIAGGIQPWWHHVGAYGEDTRMYQTAEPIMAWHKANEEYLFNRRPVASVAVGWSQRNTDFFGRDNAEENVDQPFRGITQALIRARIPFLPVHLDNLDRDSQSFNLTTLILPNVGLLSDDQLASIRRFVQRGGSLIASGQSSLFDAHGDPRPDFALADLLGVKGVRPEIFAARGGVGRGAAGGGGVSTADQQTYLRLVPQISPAYGPTRTNQQAATAPASQRHPILAGFDQTNILEFGGTLSPLTVSPGAQVLATFIPSFPAFPPEEAFMRTPTTDIPGIIVSETAAGASGVGAGRIAYLAADIDRRFAMDNLPDHGDLLANIVRWAARNTIPLQVTGSGLIDCELYQQSPPAQPNRLILHLVNVTSAGTWRAPVHELIPIGPLQIRVRMPANIPLRRARTLVSDQPLTPSVVLDFSGRSALQFELKSILDHEVIVLEP